MSHMVHCCVFFVKGFCKNFFGAGMFPLRGKNFLERCWALIFAGGGGKIKGQGGGELAARARLKASGRALQGWPGALLVQQIPQPLPELVKVFALAGE